MDLISIIVPVYNSEKYLPDTINCILKQTYDKFELILVDDCSKDNSVKLIKEFMKKDERIKLIELMKNRGSATARNIGIDNALGKYLAFIDSDDLWDNDKLEKQVKFMKEKDIAFSYTSYEFANEECVPNGKKVVAKDKLMYKEALKNNIISTITVMFDLDKIDKELIKMPNLKYVEDTATWWKILRSGYDAYGLSDVYSYYRRIPNSQSVNKFRTLKVLWNLYRKVEGLNIFSASYYFMIKNIHAVLRRV